MPRTASCNHRRAARGRRARCRPRRGRACRRSSPATSSASASSVRHSTASAPCPTWGSITDGSRISVARSSSPSRASAAAATTMASKPAAFSSRVGTLPRSSAKVRSGRRSASWARRRTEPVATSAPGPSASRVEPTNASRVGALGHRREDQPVGAGVGREVLGRVHRDVGAIVEDGLLHFLHEDAGAAHGMDGNVGASVTGGADDDELERAAEQRAHPFGLPARQRAAARRDAQRARHQSSASRSGSGRPNSSTSASA